MSHSFTNDRPIYLQLMEMIERDIASGVLPPGSRKFKQSCLFIQTFHQNAGLFFFLAVFPAFHIS